MIAMRPTAFVCVKRCLNGNNGNHDNEKILTCGRDWIVCYVIYNHLSLSCLVVTYIFEKLRKEEIMNF